MKNTTQNKQDLEVGKLTGKLVERNKAKHTAGQWSIGKPDPMGARAFYTTKDNHAYVLGYAYACAGEGEANARLIASAPELLRALESVIEDIKSPENIGLKLSELEMIVAKAKGAQ